MIADDPYDTRLGVRPATSARITETRFSMARSMSAFLASATSSAPPFAGGMPLFAGNRCGGTFACRNASRFEDSCLLSQRCLERRRRDAALRRDCAKFVHRGRGSSRIELDRTGYDCLRPFIAEAIWHTVIHFGLGVTRAAAMSTSACHLTKVRPRGGRTAVGLDRPGRPRFRAAR